MTWKLPQNEEQWSECLSAYLDGEMDEEDRIALEAYLKTDPTRLDQLQAYRKTAALLQGWQVEVPSPNANFLDRLKQEERAKSRESWKSFFFPAMHWFPFSLGGVTGAILLMILQNIVSLDRPSNIPPASMPSESQPVYNVFISQNQAENLFSEVTASGLAGQMKTQLHNSQWEEAATTYQTMYQKYSETKAFQDLKNIPSIQTFVQKYVRSRSLDS